LIRHCERSEAIQGGLRKNLDCFAVAGQFPLPRRETEGGALKGRNVAADWLGR
jgi:hypothetical protein